METKIPILKALCDPCRLSILQKIAKGEFCACGIECAGMSQPAVSQHLSKLLSAGLVKVRRTGSKRIYSATQRAKRVLKDITKW